MGCDIHGHIEIDEAHHEDGERWRSASTISAFVGRSYDTFGLLFGARNYSQFDPVADQRGFPDNAGWDTESDYESWGPDAHSATYITYEEIQNIDWEETAESPDQRYSILNENKEPTGTKFALSPHSIGGWNEIVEENREAIDAGEPVPNEEGDRYIQRRTQTRRDALSGAWDWLLHDYMGLLADRFGEDSLRMVVWFDN